MDTTEAAALIADLDKPKIGRPKNLIDPATYEKRMRAAEKEFKEAQDKLNVLKAEAEENERKAKAAAKFSLGGAIVAGLAKHPELVPMVRQLVQAAALRDIDRQGIAIIAPELLRG